MKRFSISLLVIAACIIMGIVDAVIQPGYVIKSLIKIVLFLLIPVLYSLCTKSKIEFFKADKKEISIALVLGAGIYSIILGAYFIFKDIFDFSALTSSLTETTGVNKSNFLWVALYISFVNSLLEEFFFRGFSFLNLKKFSSPGYSYVFSSTIFALYHIAMMIGWFDIPVVIITLLGLFVGGMIFNRFDDIKGNIYLSWIVHMFANFSINTIGFILFSA